MAPRAAAFVAIYAIAYIAVGLYPFDFDFDRTLRIYPMGSPADVIANIVAFMPFGFGFAAAPHAHYRRVAAAIFCTVLSLCIEALQTFVPERFPQIADVICNAAGGWIGALSWLRVTSYRRIHVRSEHSVDAP